MIVITSGAYISSEMQVEIGAIPPAFLPLGNKRLYEHQIVALKKFFKGEDIYLSIPESFALSLGDTRNLKELSINLVPVPEELSLCDSLLYVINCIAQYSATLKVLHGDTYIKSFPNDLDAIALSRFEDNYLWEYESSDSGLETIWCGYFSFSNISLLVQSLIASKSSFVNAVRIYESKCKVSHPVIEDWYDLGHVNTYFRARASITTERAFNNIVIENKILKKTSLNKNKINAESSWFLSLPPRLKVYIPQYIMPDHCGNGYYLEYLANLPLNELFVYGRLGIVFWKKVFKHIGLFLNELISFDNKDLNVQKIRNEFFGLVTTKTAERFELFCSQSNIDIAHPYSLNGVSLPSFEQIVQECQQAIFPMDDRCSIAHGDLCFSNILYDSRSDAIKLIDPRGLTYEDKFSLFGDLKYDIAKVAHSVYGLYDHIVANCFSLERPSKHAYTFEVYIEEEVKIVQDYFSQEVNYLGFSCREMIPIQILLFLSMTPLHSEDTKRQHAFLANSLRLYSLWRGC